jgi:hypothetical protein
MLGGSSANNGEASRAGHDKRRHRDALQRLAPAGHSDALTALSAAAGSIQA